MGKVRNRVFAPVYNAAGGSLHNHAACGMINPNMKPILFLLAGGLCIWAQAPTQWTPEFTLQFQNVGNAVPSPDGRMLAWTQTRYVVEPEKSEMLGHVWVGAADGSRRVQLTRGDKSAGSPAWSPDGRYVFFTSARSGKNNVYRIRIAGGEAQMLTDVKGAVGQFEVSPDGKWLAYTAVEPDPEEEKARKEKRDMRVLDQKPANAVLFVIPVEENEEGHRPSKKMSDPARHVVEMTWSPDSSAIAFVHWAAPVFENWHKGELAEVNVSSGAVKDLGVVKSTSGTAVHTVQRPLYSPDGRFLAFARSAEAPARWAFQNKIVLMNRQSGQLRELPATYDEQPNLIGWTADSSRLLFSEARRTRTAIFEMPVDGPPRVWFEPPAGVLQGIQLNAKGTHLGFVHEKPDEAPEAYLSPVSSPAPMRVSAANTGVPRLPLGRTEAVRWKSRDGREIEGLLTYPVGFEKGKRYPLVLNIHGGPTGVFGENFIGRPGLYPIATFAARGYLVLRPNPRGSSGYGKEFRFANYNDWGGMDYLDDQAGVDWLIAQGVADPDRMAIMGWSYGGYMTSWTITQTQRYKAAVVGAGVTNLWSFNGTADIQGFIPDYFGGEQYQQPERYAKHSPVMHVAKVTTPTLVLHGEKDDRVPVSQGFEYYNALKRRGVTAKMVVYPRTPHGPQEPKFVLDIMQRHLDWVEKYVR
jgi:dipeptidyl aminopeptidase/acylaminoacyl peptidase